MENVLVSACLLGVSCRYDGNSKPDEKIISLKEKYNLIPVCPEIMGGLPTPRPSVELSHGRAVTRSGNEVTDNFTRGAQETLLLAKIFGCKKAILKENSPSCGFGHIYDGTFSHTISAGNGITAGLLAENRIKIFNERSVHESN